jgi:hypothetical protein
MRTAIVCVLICSIASPLLGQEPTPLAPAAASGAETPTATEFRVETELLVGDEPKPLSEHLTLFSKGMVFDLLRPDESQITVFDLPRDRIVLIDRQRELQCVLAPADLIDLVARLRSEAPEDAKQLGLDAEVVWRKEPIPGWMASAGNARYLIRPQAAPDPKYARAFADFADWSARLNAYRKVGSAPFLRMALNARLAEAGQLPEEVLLTIEPILGRDRLLRTRHLVNYQLSSLDREKIAAVSRHIAVYRQASWQEFVAGKTEE